MESAFEKDIDPLLVSGGMQREEYRLIAEIVAQHAPCNLLVYSVGNDSKLWTKANAGGRTVFLEDSEEWLCKINEKYDIDARLVSYDPPRHKWKYFLNKFKRFGSCQELNVCLDEDLVSIDWDVVIVDGPMGGYDGTFHGDGPGRASSIYDGYMRASVGADIFIHDSNREIEEEYARALVDKGLCEFIEKTLSLTHLRKIQ